MIGVKAGVGHLNHKGVMKWLESIHKDTLNYGSKEEQYVIEQLLHYITKDYKDKKGLENKNIMGY